LYFQLLSIQGVSENSWTVVVVTALVKEEEGGRPRPHFRKPIASVCHVTPHCEHGLFLHECFLTSCLILSAMGVKIEQRVCIKFCVKLSKSSTETLEMLHEAFGEHSLSWTAVFE
jgi:hypothetical protein